MEELKSCIFCGKGVDRDYAYCPWCGYEFGPGDDAVGPAEDDGSHCESSSGDGIENRGESPLDDGSGNRCESLAAALFGSAREAPAAALEEPLGAPAAPPHPATDLASVLRRLRRLEGLLAEMEEELDLMIRNASAGP